MQDYSSYDDRLLFQLIASDDEAAFTELFHRYRTKLFPFVKRITRSEEQAREIIQETFIKVWVKRDQLKEITQPSSWIFRIASNHCLGWLRDEANHRRILEHRQGGGNQPGEQELVEAKQLNFIIHRAIESLPEKRQEIYRLSREKGLTHQEIADQLNISLQTVKNQIGSALRSIQEYINKETGLSMAVLIVLFRM